MYKTIFSSLLIVLFLASCARQEGSIGEPKNPAVLLLSPLHGAKLSEADKKSFEAFLQKEAGFSVEVRVAKTPSLAIEAFRDVAGGADVGLLNLFEYLLAHEEYKVQAELQVIRSGASNYTGEILVKKDSGITDLKGLEGKKIAYVDAYSSSGFVYPSLLLSEAGVKTSSSFAGSPEKAIENLLTGQADAAAVYTTTKDSSLQAISTTQKIPNEPVFFRNGFSEDKKKALKAALEKFTTTPEGQKILPTIAGVTSFATISDENYNTAAQVVRASGKTTTELVQRGWEVNRPEVDLVP